MRLPAWLGWRLGHVARRGAARASASAIRLIARHAMLHRLPRPLIATIERVLIRTARELRFDAAGYLARNPDVATGRVGALEHYLRYGWAEARTGGAPENAMTPRPGSAGPISPLARYLASPDEPTGAPLPPLDIAPVAHLLRRLGRLEAQPDPDSGPEPVVDVIVPVYRGRAETLNTLLHVLGAANATPFRLVVVDDRGPDAALRRDPAAFARRGLCDLIVNPRNLGFVAATNAGMALHPKRDVIWLNADTEVHGDWIDRLVAVAEADPGIATVTPLTNNGTIASYPAFDRDNPDPLEIGWSSLDRLAAKANGLASTEAPSCVGFCTYVRRAALDAAGPLDEQSFGRGYGEENDFSRRVAALGWSNVIAGGVFVRHLGATSFGAERAARIGPAMRRLASLHPDYPALVRRFVADDPVAPMRLALDLARLVRAAPAPAVLLVSHRRGGGTRRHVDEEIARLARRGYGAVVLQGGTAPGTVRLEAGGAGPLPALSAVAFRQDALLPILRALGIVRIHVHHLIELPADAPGRLTALADALGVPLDVTVHDYFAICPRINLTDAAGHYCGEPDERGCRRCLALRRSEVGRPDIAGWRRGHGALLAAARAVLVPDQDVAERLIRYFPDLEQIEVVAHETVARPVPASGGAGPLRIAVIGAIGPIKGFDVLIRLARAIRRSGRPVELVIVGHTRNDKAARDEGITVTGRYAEADIQARIGEVAPHLIFCPSTWPETFCYALSHALRSGRPVAVFDLGAQARRLRKAGGAGVLPLALAHQPDALLDRLCGLALQPAGVAPDAPFPESPTTL